MTSAWVGSTGNRNMREVKWNDVIDRTWGQCRDRIPENALAPSTMRERTIVAIEIISGE